jgi:ascorbate-specific PTS system EIIC-type component UlaA
MVQTIVGYLLLIIGAGMEVVTVLVWAGIIKPVVTGLAIGSIPYWDILLLLLKNAPWPAAVGVIMIYAGLKLLKVNLPF